MIPNTDYHNGGEVLSDELRFVVNSIVQHKNDKELLRQCKAENKLLNKKILKLEAELLDLRLRLA